MRGKTETSLERDGENTDDHEHFMHKRKGHAGQDARGEIAKHQRSAPLHNALKQTASGRPNQKGRADGNTTEDVD